MEDDGDREFLRENDNKINISIGRPSAPKINPAKDSLTFMQVDIDYTQVVPPCKYPLFNL